MRKTKADKEKADVVAQQALAKTDRMAFLSGSHKEVLRRRAAGQSLAEMERELDMTRKQVQALYDEALRIADE